MIESCVRQGPDYMSDEETEEIGRKISEEASPAEGFGPSRMIECAGCSRSNPPTRTDCIYCGAELELTAEQRDSLRPVLKKIGDLDRGFNIIVVYGSRIADPAAAAEAAAMLRLGAAELQQMLDSGSPVPAGRAGSEAEAHIVCEKLSVLGIEAEVVSDADLAHTTPPARLRGLDFGENSIVPHLFNSDGREAKPARVALIVTGAIFRKELESTEKKKRGGESQILESTEIGSDEFLIDLYPPEEAAGFRIRGEGFDFSCLGAEKKLLASENLSLLSEKLRAAFPEARFVDDYGKLRRTLGLVWPLTESSSSAGWQRKSFGGYAVQKVTRTDNVDQFTRYSRLRHRLMLREARS